jgi:hypothetical protein
MTTLQFSQFFSVDSPKAIKAAKFNYLNAINYMAPHKSGNVGNLCSHASPGCIALCLGWFSGQAGMVPQGGTNNVRQSRIRKAEYFMKDRKAYLHEMFIHTAKLIAKARRMNLTLCERPNGSTDIAYEGQKLIVDAAFAAELSRLSGETIEPGTHSIFTAFPMVQFVDYTKNHLRFNRPLPANYHLTFSLSETNEQQARALLSRGHNVAIVFGCERPATWHGYTVIDGDEHDLRHLDPHNVVVGLTPKGNKAKRDTSGFVVRDTAAV